jgi:pimeloyl-ACP methyl ester carboxylesterase
VSVDETTIELAGSPVLYRSAPAPSNPAGGAGGSPDPVPSPDPLLSHDPVLYLHGVPTSSADWLPFLQRTGGIAPDLPGFGRSGKGGHLDYSINGHARFLEQFLEALEIDRVRLVVHDWGAAGGLVFAQRAPERIAKLVVIDALPLLPGYEWHRTARFLRRPLLGELAAGATPKWLLALILREAAPFTEERLDTVWEELDEGTLRAILRLHRSADEQRLAEAGHELGAIDAESLVVWGENDPWFPAAFAEAYARALPNATVQPIPGAGHWPWVEQPHVIDTVTEFLS